MTRTILNWWTGAVIWSGEAETVKDAIHAALAAGANLRGADLTGANLRDADLSGADLRGTNLSDADLAGANLRGTNLTLADLTDANLRDADLAGANLRGTNLRGTTLIRDDLWAVLSGAPAEVPTLITKLKAGEVDGSCYSGVCACLVGTLANARGCDYTALAPILPNPGRPAEVFFIAIHPGDTPETSTACKQAVAWCEEWLSRMQAAFMPAQVS